MKLYILPRIHQNIVSDLDTHFAGKKTIKLICLKSSKYDKKYSTYILNKSNLLSTLSKLILGNLPNNGFIIPSYSSLKYLFMSIFSSDIIVLRELRFPTTIFSLLITFFWNKKTILKIQHNNSSVPLSYLITLKIYKVFGRSLYIENVLPFKSKYFKYVPFKRPKLNREINKLSNDFSEIVITSIGKLESRKRLIFSLMVARDLASNDYFRKVKLNLFITFKDKYSDHIYSQLKSFKELVISDFPRIEINFFNDTSNSEVLNTLANSHIYLHPADNEPASYSIIEAYTTGAYVLSKTDCYTTDYLPFKECGMKICDLSSYRVAKYIFEKFNIISDFKNRKYRSIQDFSII